MRQTFIIGGIPLSGCEYLYATDMREWDNNEWVLYIVHITVEIAIATAMRGWNNNELVCSQ